MPDPDFEGLRNRLLYAGIAPYHARRTILELQEHHADLQDELIRGGFEQCDAQIEASRQLGPLDVIADLVIARTELRRWTYRYPRIGRIVLPIACALVLPAAPLIAGIAYASAIARWSAIMSLSAMITAVMFLAIQMSITLG